MCRLSRAFALSINGTQIAIWISMTSWYLTHCQVKKDQVSLQKCTDSPELSLLAYTYIAKISVLVSISNIGTRVSKAKARNFGTDEGSDEGVQMCWIARAIVTSRCDKSTFARSNGNFGIIYASNECSSKQAYLIIPQFQNTSLLKWKFVCQKRRLLWVCKFAQARLNIHNSIRIPRACSIGGLCAIYTSSQGSSESAPANIIRVCNHRCLRTDSSRNHLVPILILLADICPRFCCSQRPFQAAIAHANGRWY